MRSAPRPQTPVPAAGVDPAAVGIGLIQTEIELRLLARPGTLKDLISLPALSPLATGPAVTRQVRTDYFDTPDLRLAALGIALRERWTDAGIVRGVKTFGAPGPVPERHELEWPVGTPVGDGFEVPAHFGDPVPPELAAASVRLLTTDVRRTILALQPSPSVLVELCVDDGVLSAKPPGHGSIEAPLHEVELELKQGRVADLYALAALLHRSVPLRLTALSKVDEGFALLTGRRPRAKPAGPTGLTPATSVAEALRQIGRNVLSQFLVNEPALAAGADPAALRELSAAARRLDAAFSLFKATVDDPRSAGLRHEARQLAGQLVRARAQERAMDRLASALPRGSSELRPLLSAASGRRRAARILARDLLRSPRWTAWVLDFATWLEASEWAAAAGLDQPMIERSGHLLGARLEKVERARQRAAAMGRGRDLERFARQVDRLRYGVDFTRGLSPPATLRPLTAALSTVRDGLRRAEDDGAALAFLRAAMADLPDAARALVKPMAKTLKKGAKQGREDALAAWRTVESAWPAQA